MRNHIKRKIPFYPLIMLISYTFSNGRISGKGILYFFIFSFRFILFEPLRLIELFVFDKRIKQHQLVEDPIFVLGYWRSGTTHLQNLLNKNTNHTTNTLFRFLFSDIYYLTEAWLKPPLNWLFKVFRVPYALQRKLWDFDLSAELDCSLCTFSSTSAYTWGQIFPQKFQKLTFPFLQMDNHLLAKQWIEDYDFLIRKLSYYQKNKRVIVKSPGDISRVHLLLNKYPNAKFVYIHRHPIDVFHSNRYLWKVIQNETSFQKITQAQMDKYIIQTYKLIISKYLENRKCLASNQLIEISFHQLQNEPLTTLKQIYTQLELGNLELKEIKLFLEKNKSYKTNSYITSSVLEKRLKTEWQFAFEAMKES
jgi:hypothetical protein